MMKDAGGDKITFGVETGNAEILRQMEKGTSCTLWRSCADNDARGQV